MAAKSIAVLGGGLAGLSAAEALVRGGHTVTLFEASDTLGGFIRTEETGGWLIESGPNSFQEATDSLRQTIARLGLAPERLEASPAARHRFVVRRGRLVPLPLSPPAFLTSPLFSPGTKAKVLLEFFRRPAARLQDISVAAFVRDHFGQEILDYAVQPFVSGIYAGDPEALSVEQAFPTLAALEKKHGSLLRAQLALKRPRANEPRALPAVISFKSGLAALVAAYVARLPAGSIRRHSRVTGLRREGNWRVSVVGADAATGESFDAVISTLPAGALATLAIGRGEPSPLATLGAVPHPPVASLFLGYRREQVAHPLNGFGVLVPSLEKRNLLGALFSSTLFAGRAPQGHVAITALAGGALAPGLARLDQAGLLRALAPDLQLLLGVRGEPVFIRHAAWPRSIPQYDLRHARVLSAITAAETAHPGLFIGGMIRDGISLPAAIAAGERLAAAASR